MQEDQLKKVFFIHAKYRVSKKASTRIYSADESAFFGHLKVSNTVLWKTGHQQCKTSLLTIIRSAWLLYWMQTRLVWSLLQYERISLHITNNMPDGWGIDKSERGWMTDQTFFEYMVSIFVPCWRENSIIFLNKIENYNGNWNQKQLRNKWNKWKGEFYHRLHLNRVETPVRIWRRTLLYKWWTSESNLWSEFT